MQKVRFFIAAIALFTLDACQNNEKDTSEFLAANYDSLALATMQPMAQYVEYDEVKDQHELIRIIGSYIVHIADTVCIQVCLPSKDITSSKLEVFYLPQGLRAQCFATHYIQKLNDSLLVKEHLGSCYFLSDKLKIHNDSLIKILKYNSEIFIDWYSLHKKMTSDELYSEWTKNYENKLIEIDALPIRRSQVE